MEEYISIIITTFNAQRWLSRCLDSVLTAADENCEIIIVDDGSTDDTLLISQKYEQQDERVVSFVNEHQGFAAARKFGVDNCNGDSVIFVDCDDTLPPNAITELRTASVEGCDIVCGNVVMHDMNGKKKLTLSGSFEVISGTEFALRTLSEGIYTTLSGKKFARYLFDVNEWDTDTSLSILSQRVHLLHLACTATKVAIAPRFVVYNHISRAHSMSAMFTLHLDGVERAWNSVSNLPLPPKRLTEWGLDLIDMTLIQRGFPFNNDYPPVVDIRYRAKKLNLSQHHRKILRLLSSKHMRLSQARDNVAEGYLNTDGLHISFIVPVHNNAHKLLRTLKSILRTGLRNIQIIVVDDASNRKTSVALSAITIRFPRVLLLRHPQRYGLAQAYRTGLNNAGGSVIYFVDAGDLVKRDGIIESSMLIDKGADMVFLGIQSQFWHIPFRWEYFTPSKWPPIQNGINELLYSLIERGALNVSLRSMAFSRSFLNSDLLCERGVNYGSGYLSMINILLANPSCACTDTVGFINASRYPMRTYVIKRNCSLDIELAERTRETMIHINRKSEYTDALIAHGVIASLSRSLAAIIANPFRGVKTAIKLAHDILSLDSTVALFEKLNYQLPHPDDLVENAHKTAHAERLLFFLGYQSNF